MTSRAAITRVEGAVLAAGGTFHARGTDVYRSVGVCHEGQRSEALVIFYDLQRGHVNVYCHAGCDRDTILGRIGLREADLYDEPLGGELTLTWPPRIASPPRRQDPLLFDPAPHLWHPPADAWMPCGHAKVAEYVYADEFDRVVFGVARCELKGNGCEGFRQWRPIGRKPYRKWSLTGPDDAGVLRTVRVVPFHLPALRTAIAAGRTVYLPEGEKDVLALESAGQAATCNHEGAMKWTAEHHAAHLRGANVVIVADCDPAGRRHAELVVSTLLPLAATVSVVVAAQGKDAHDHLSAGLTCEQFELIWQPKVSREDA